MFICNFFVLCWWLHTCKGYGDIYCIGKIYIIFLQYKGSWAWQNFYQAKIFGYTVFSWKYIYIMQCRGVPFMEGKDFAWILSDFVIVAIACVVMIIHFTRSTINHVYHKWKCWDRSHLLSVVVVILSQTSSIIVHLGKYLKQVHHTVPVYLESDYLVCFFNSIVFSPQ